MSGTSTDRDAAVQLDPSTPRILICTPDEADAARIRAACGMLECTVAVADDVHAAMGAAAAEDFDVVFVDGAFGERRVEDVINAVRRRNAAVAIVLLATPEQVEGEPMLLMLVGYEYLTKPVHEETVSAEVQLRLNQQRTRRVTAALASTLDYEALLDVLLQLAMQEVSAGTASILMPGSEGGPLEMEASCGLPDEVVDGGHDVRDDGIAEWVFEHGEPLILQGGFNEQPFTSIAGERRIASAMVLPLLLGEQKLGVLCVARIGERTQPYTLRQLRAMEIIGLQAAVAIHSARMHRALLGQQKWENELEMAKAVQQHLLPREFPRQRGVAVHAVNLPARQIGGDFYNVFRLGESRLGVVIADVSGKGIPGALLMIQSSSDMRFALEEGAGPADVLARLNETVVTNSTRGMFVTLLYAVIDSELGTVEFANAGHLPFLLVPGSGVPCTLVGHAEDPPLGIAGGVQFVTGQFAIAGGDSLLLYTDGVVEAKNPQGEEYGFERLRQLVDAPRPQIAPLADLVAESVQAFAGSQPQHDDLTLVSVSLAPDPGDAQNQR